MAVMMMFTPVCYLIQVFISLSHRLMLSIMCSILHCTTLNFFIAVLLLSVHVWPSYFITWCIRCAQVYFTYSKYFDLLARTFILVLGWLVGIKNSKKKIRTFLEYQNQKNWCLYYDIPKWIFFFIVFISLFLFRTWFSTAGINDEMINIDWFLTKIYRSHP